MLSAAVVALALLESTSAFQAPVLKTSTKAISATMKFKEGDIGILPPLGVYDPLGLIGTKDMTRFEIMEIKHGRAAMLGFLHTILIEAGARFPGYISPSNGLKFADIPTGNFAALEALPTAGWLQIMTVTCMMETGAFLSQAPCHSPHIHILIGGARTCEHWSRARVAGLLLLEINPDPYPNPNPGYFLFEAQTPGSVPGDVGGEQWVRYPDKATKIFKLNVERQNGRAAMHGITGCLLHELLGVDALYPTGGMGGAAPPAIF